MRKVANMVQVRDIRIKGGAVKLALHKICNTFLKRRSYIIVTLELIAYSDSPAKFYKRL